MADDNIDENASEIRRSNAQFRAKVGFVVGITFASIIGGFGLALGNARKRSPTSFAGNRHDEGAKLAMRALGWGTLYAVGGVTSICVAGASAYELRKVLFR